MSEIWDARSTQHAACFCFPFPFWPPDPGPVCTQEFCPRSGQNVQQCGLALTSPISLAAYCLLPLTSSPSSTIYHHLPVTVPVPPIHLPSRRFLARHPTCPSSSPSNSFTSPDILHPTPPAHTRSADPPLVNQTRKIFVPSCTQM